MNFRDRNYMITSSRTESLKAAAYLTKMLGILHGRRVPSPHAELVAVVNRVSMTVPVTINYENGIMPGAEY